MNSHMNDNQMFFKGKGERAGDSPWIIITGIHVAEIAATVTTYELVRSLLFNREGFQDHPDIYLLRRANSDLHFIDDGPNRNHLFVTEKQANDGAASQMHLASWKEACNGDGTALLDVIKIKEFIEHAHAQGARALVSLHAMGFPIEYQARAYASPKAIDRLSNLMLVEKQPSGWKHNRINWGSIPTYVDEKYGIPAVDLEFHSDETDLNSARINSEYVIKVLEAITSGK